MTTRPELPAKFVGETKLYEFDFSSQLAAGETISGKTVAAATYSGIDTSPSSLVSGSATNSGAVVSQMVTGGTLGVLYELTCTVVTSLSQTLQQKGYLAVVQGVP